MNTKPTNINIIHNIESCRVFAEHENSTDAIVTMLKYRIWFRSNYDIKIRLSNHHGLVYIDLTQNENAYDMAVAFKIAFA